MSTPPMDETDIERELKRRIREQAAQIAVAMGYLQSGQPNLASQVLEGACPAPPQTENRE